MLALPLTLLTLAATALAEPAPPKFTYLYSANLIFGAPVQIGAVSTGNRAILSIVGGAFTGPKLTGKIGTGLDWGLTDSKGTFSPDALYTLTTNDNATIVVYEKGHAPNVQILFETSSEKYAWLNSAAGYATGGQTATGVSLDVWQLGA